MLQYHSEMGMKMSKTHSAVVIGGGIAGLQASLDLANNGFKVTLIERQHRIGGTVAKLSKLFPTLKSAEDVIKPLMESVVSNTNIKVLTQSEVQSVQGSIGNFKVTVTGQQQKEIDADVIIVATGFQQYDAKKVGQYKYGQYRNVINGLEYEQMCNPNGPTNGKIVRLDNGEKPKSVVYVLCVGSRDEKHLRYCCNIGCLNAIKHAYLLREQYGKEVDAYVCYTDIRAVTKKGEQFYNQVRNMEVEFIHGQPSEIREAKDGTLTLDVYDQATSKLMSITADLIVLEVGLLPQTDLKNMLKLPVDEDGFFAEKNAQLEVNETPVKGIFLAGGVQQPMRTNEAMTNASAAVLRAINSITSK
jgi:heterodisulfide reductase subunit A-like polyferredoxin